jgi:hypothetical protein
VIGTTAFPRQKSKERSGSWAGDMAKIKHHRAPSWLWEPMSQEMKNEEWILMKTMRNDLRMKIQDGILIRICDE